MSMSISTVRRLAKAKRALRYAWIGHVESRVQWVRLRIKYRHDIRFIRAFQRNFKRDGSYTIEA